MVKIPLFFPLLRICCLHRRKDSNVHCFFADLCTRKIKIENNTIMRKKRFSLSDCLTEDVKVIEQDLSYEHSIEGVDMSIMEIVEKKVSPELYDMLKDMLLGFDDAMQLEMADDLLDFAHGHVIHTTGCPSADYVLELCYAYIADEHGILDGEAIQNMLNHYKN